MQSITCPHCQKSFEVDQALEKEVAQHLEKEFEKKLAAQLATEREKATEKAKEEVSVEIKKLEAEKKSREEKIDKLLADLLKTTDKVQALEQKDKEREYEMKKQMQEQTEKLAEKIAKEEAEKNHLKLAEMQKQLEDTKKALEDAQRKSSQVSQQLQGEVLELELEHMLKATFPADEVVAVGKGVHGADIRHIVKSPGGIACGTILWEIKRTKNWDDKWIPKLKEDMRAEGAHVPVIVSMELPKEARDGMGLKDNVWICSQTLVLPLAELLRKNLYDVAKQKHLNTQQSSKADLLYGYITGHEFQQQVERILEVRKDMLTQIDREKAALTRSWKQREEQVEKILLTTATIIGSMQGKIGSTVLQIKGLDMPLLDEGE